MPIPKNPIFTQCVLGAVIIGATWFTAHLHRAHTDHQTSISLTTEKTEEVAKAALSQYQQRPFRVSTHIRHYASVRDTEGRSRETKRIYALGAERLIVLNNRLNVILSKATEATDPTAFVETNIGNQERKLEQFIEKNRVIPPGSKVAIEYAAMLQEMELWQRADQHLLQQSTVKPIIQNPESLL
ncbi:hypothetical protein IQ266_18860 [filamentous cyanobacterium LEGE 11480]|uniref:Uncharacterized protein n=1 Tax=Romeriopsis navalis LEGE 11480 TaxID=2777977 RepID=A0A928VT81_9CYAN|nr:hypothetical protein [Romeriopsis navalis]MBE9031799.1 hypothetical protein [Romeriopsis navalis LEGE 11480]